MKFARSSLIVCFGSVLVAGMAAAHHNTGAAFDLDQDVTIEGAVSRYEWKNPHLYFYVETTDEGGNTLVWRVEAGPLSIMRRLGWTRYSLTVGQRVIVTGNPSRRADKNSAFLKSIDTTEGSLPPFQGEESFNALTSSSTPAGKFAEGLAGTWVTLVDGEVLGPLNDPSLLSLTPEGTASVEAFDERTMHPALDCIPSTAPLMMLIPDIKSIEIFGDVIRIRGEFDNAERSIQLEPAAEASDKATLHGHSVGRWVGQVLIIETTQFAEHRLGIAFGLASSAQKHLKEEFELNADRTSLTYRFDLRDPKYLAEPFSGEVQWIYRPDIEYSSLECDLENSRLFLDE